MNTAPQSTRSHTCRSAVYTGWLRHRRFAPLSHEFTYPVFMLYLDLDELEALFRGKWYCSLNRPNILSFRRSDYFDPGGGDLKVAVVRYVESALRQEGMRAGGIDRVVLLTNPRCFNFVFNPVSFYYCFATGGELRAIMAEITNTPWGERHAYVLPVGLETGSVAWQGRGAGRHTFRFEKQFHVSPFNPMDMRYTWRFKEPGDTLLVHMDNHMTADVAGGAEKHFDATLKLDRNEFRAGLPRALIRYPFMTVKVVAGIYWQAFRLWSRGARFYPHPAEQESGKTAGRPENSLSNAIIRQVDTK